MRKRLITLLCIVVTAISINAQDFTKSYRCVSVATSMGPQVPPAGMATWIEFYDDYIMVMGTQEFTYDGDNSDGTRRYVATRQGPPAFNTIGWLVAEDYSAVKQVMQSTMMGMTLQMEYFYSYIGEGSHPAQNIMGAGSSYYGDDDDDYGYSCTSCGGTRRCKFCGGSGRYGYGTNGKCGVCRGTGRCQACNR